MSEKEKKIKERTFDFTIEVVKLVKLLPENTAGFELGRQLLKAGTSIGANVEEATGARTKKEFTNCMNIAKKEARETRYWLRLVLFSELISNSKIKSLLDEIEIIIKILTSIVKTSESNL
ncbi:MAG: four helix bundle protein [Candidatus Omnitrophota bacterium]